MENLNKVFTKDEQFANILEALGEGLGFVDQNEIFSYVNKAASEIFGYPREEMLGKSLQIFMSDAEYQKILTETSKRKDGVIGTYENEIIRKDGTRKTILVTASPRFEQNHYVGAYGIFRDITELKNTTNALKESEKRFRTVSDIISDFAISFLVGKDQSLTPEWYSGALPLLNEMGKELAMDSSTWLKTCHPDDKDKIQNAFSQLFNYKESILFEYRIIRSNGSTDWLEIYATPEIDKYENLVIRILVAGRIITPTKIIEQELRLNQYMVDHAADCIYLIQPDASIVYANDAACKLLGYTREEFQSLKIYDLDPHFRRDKVAENWNLIRENKTMSLESQQKKKDSTIITVDITINFLDFEQQEYGVAFIRDITDRKAEEHIKNVVSKIDSSIGFTNSILDLFQIIRTELSILLDNRNLYLILTTAGNIVFRIYYQKNNEPVCEDIPVSKTIESWVISSKKPCLLRSKDIRVLEEDGSINKFGTPAKCHLGVPLLIGNQVIGIIAITSFEDEHAFNEQHLKILGLLTPQISLAIHRRQSEEALKKSEEHLRESNIAKDKFFSIIAHDLRGPFNAIIGFSDLLFNDYESLEESEKMTMIKNIHDASVGTFKLLENLLEWSRIRTGRTVPSPENIDLSTVANGTLGFLKAFAEKKNIKLFSGIHFGTIAYCDENMITTVVRNLIANAIKFTLPGGNVRIWASSKEDCVEVTVADSGIGISAENMKKLFRLDESIKTRGTSGEQGTGLGLLLSKEFIELNEGKIWVESEPGKGSQFHFTLPKLAL